MTPEQLCDPDHVKKIIRCVPFITPEAGVHETQDVLQAQMDLIRELKAEIARRDSFDGCDGCSTGDCPHDFERECIAAQGELIRELEARCQKLVNVRCAVEFESVNYNSIEGGD